MTTELELAPLADRVEALSGGDREVIATFNGGPFTPLTAGVHQRCDDTYFEVVQRSPSASKIAASRWPKFGWYWTNLTAEMEWGGDHHGPFNTAEAAAYSGWANDPAALCAMARSIQGKE